MIAVVLCSQPEPDGGRSAGDGRQGSMKRRTGIAAGYIAPALPEIKSVRPWARPLQAEFL